MARNISDLREVLFETMNAVRNGTLDVEKAKVISELGQVMVNTAKTEVDFVKATNQTKSDFISPEKMPDLPPGITGIRRHTLEG